ncbi:hypothetical protein ES702_06739 [subsurface metagenome]
MNNSMCQVPTEENNQKCVRSKLECVRSVKKMCQVNVSGRNRGGGLKMCQVNVSGHFKKCVNLLNIKEGLIKRMYLKLREIKKSSPMKKYRRGEQGMGGTALTEKKGDRGFLVKSYISGLRVTDSKRERKREVNLTVQISGSMTQRAKRMIGLNYIYFEGACPFLLCTKQKPHLHSICPECRSVRHGNLFCGTCREYRKEAISD